MEFEDVKPKIKQVELGENFSNFFNHELRRKKQLDFQELLKKQLNRQQLLKQDPKLEPQDVEIKLGKLEIKFDTKPWKDEEEAERKRQKLNLALMTSKASSYKSKNRKGQS